MNISSCARILTLAAIIGLVGAGCTQSPIPTPTPVTPSPLSSLPSGWQRYTHTQPTFSFGYPMEASATSSNPAFPQDILSVDLGRTATTNTQAISIPDRQLHVRIVTENDKQIKNCFYSDGGWTDDYNPSQTHTTINGQDICVTTESDVGAGNYYHTYNYSALINNHYVVMSFIVHSVNCMNYDNPSVQCVDFDESRDTAIFKDIMNTFRIN